MKNKILIIITSILLLIPAISFGQSEQLLPYNVKIAGYTKLGGELAIDSIWSVGDTAIHLRAEGVVYNLSGGGSSATLDTSGLASKTFVIQQFDNFSDTMTVDTVDVNGLETFVDNRITGAGGVTANQIGDSIDNARAYTDVQIQNYNDTIPKPPGGIAAILLQNALGDMIIDSDFGYTSNVLTIDGEIEASSVRLDLTGGAATDWQFGIDYLEYFNSNTWTITDSYGTRISFRDTEINVNDNFEIGNSGTNYTLSLNGVSFTEEDLQSGGGGSSGFDGILRNQIFNPSNIVFSDSVNVISYNDYTQIGNITITTPTGDFNQDDEFTVLIESDGSDITSPISFGRNIDSYDNTSGTWVYSSWYQGTRWIYSLTDIYFASNDTSPPTLTNESISNISQTTAQYNVQSSESSTIYWMVLDSIHTTPSKSDILTQSGAIDADSIVTNGNILESSSITGLDSDTAYYLFRYAKDLVDNETDIDSILFNTTAIPALSIPQNFTASGISTDTIQITWDDVSNEVEYLIDVSLTGSSGWSELARPNQDDTVHYHSGLAAESQRYYRMKSLGDTVTYLNSDYTSTETAITLSGSGTGIVDSIGDAWGVWSTRKLVSGYSGNCLQILRDSDDATQDIGFDGNGNCDTAAINSFLGASYGYVTIVYDQLNVSARNLVTSATKNEKPLINIDEFGEASIQHTDSSFGLFINSFINVTQPMTLFLAQSHTKGLGTYDYFADGTPDRKQFAVNGSGTVFLDNGVSGGTLTEDYHNYIYVMDQINTVLYVDGTSFLSGDIGTSEWSIGTFGTNAVKTQTSRIYNLAIIVFEKTLDGTQRAILDNEFNDY